MTAVGSERTLTESGVRPDFQSLETRFAPLSRRARGVAAELNDIKYFVRSLRKPAENNVSLKRVRARARRLLTAGRKARRYYFTPRSVIPETSVEKRNEIRF